MQIVIQNTIRLYVSVVLLVLLSSFIFSNVANAQIAANTSIFTNPSTVKPNELFSVGLISSDIDLDTATVSWYINGKLGLAGVGERGFSMNAGPIGTSFIVRAIIEPASGATIRKSILVKPYEIDFLWHSFSYTPPFYEGRSLASPGGAVKITAMPNIAGPNGEQLDPSELIYQWSQSGVILGNASGRGKQSIILEGGLDANAPLRISLDIRSVDNTVSGSANVTVPVVDTFVMLYAHHPILGTLHERVLRQAQVGENDLVVRAVPYFFSRDDVLSGQLEYVWKVNNKNIPPENLDAENQITLRKNIEANSGNARLNVNIQNMNLPFRIKQRAERSLEIELR